MALIIMVTQEEYDGNYSIMCLKYNSFHTSINISLDVLLLFLVDKQINKPAKTICPFRRLAQLAIVGKDLSCLWINTHTHQFVFIIND